MLALWLSMLIQQPAEPPVTPDTATQILSLRGALDLAKANNFDLQIARERLARAAVLSKKAWSVVLPKISVGAQAVRNNREITFQTGLPPELEPLLPPGVTVEPETVQIQKLYQQSAGAEFTWALLNGRSIPLLKNAYASVDLAELNYKELEVTLLYSTALAYFNVLNAQQQIGISERALVNRREHLRYEQARLAVGDNTEVNVLRADVEVVTEEQRLISARNASRIARSSLAMLIGWMQNDGTVRPFAVERPETHDDIPEDLLARALGSRLDYKAQHVQLEIAKNSKTETWTKFLPVLAGIGNYRWTNVDGFLGQRTSWQVGLALSWAIFEGGQTYWELQERQHDINAAVIQLEESQDDIARQVTEARLNLESAHKNFEVAKRRVDLAQRSATLVDIQYKVGAATQIDVLDASRTTQDAETAAALAQLSLDVARLTLIQTQYIPAGQGSGVNGNNMAAQGTAIQQSGGDTAAQAAAGAQSTAAGATGASLGIGF